MLTDQRDNRHAAIPIIADDPRLPPVARLDRIANLERGMQLRAPASLHAADALRATHFVGSINVHLTLLATLGRSHGAHHSIGMTCLHGLP
jgi:hypothetical protein